MSVKNAGPVGHGVHEPKGRGVAYAATAYTVWGLFPLYFLQLVQVPAIEVVLHRTVWCLVFLLGVMLVLRRWAWVGELRHQPRVLVAFALSALLLSVNWLVYVWAIQHRHVVDASLGYFILPLVNVALGFIFLRERPRPGQWLAVAVASTGVLWLTVQTGRPPWIALLLAGSFGFYGLLRKVGKLGALEGLTLETLMLAPFAAAVLAYWTWHSEGVMAQGRAGEMAWLMLAGPLTAVTLLLFAAGARRLPMTTLGILQYISPTVQFGLGVYIFGEAFESSRLLGFVLIWAALLVYSLESWWWSSQRSTVPSAAGL